MLQDGDEAFLRVDCRTPAQLLPPGTAADAHNKRFDDGMAGPRFGTSLEAWGGVPAFGTRARNLITANWEYPPEPTTYTGYKVITGFVPGKRYYFDLGNAKYLSSDNHDPDNFNDLLPHGTIYSASQFFIAEQTFYFLWTDITGPVGPPPPGAPPWITTQPITAAVYLYTANPCAFKRWDTPGRTDVLILVNDDWRANPADQELASYIFVDSTGKGYQPGDICPLAGGTYTTPASIRVLTVNTPTIATIDNPGTGYMVGDTLTITFDVTPMLIQVLIVDGGGGITSFSVTQPGVSSLTITNPLAVTGGSGTGASFNVVTQIETSSLEEPGHYTAVPSNPIEVTGGAPNSTISAVWDALSEGGEDGGRGRAWRILSGNVPLPIPLNGHDVWDTSRLVPTQDGLILFRDGNERHYFGPSAVDVSADTIQLNTAPAWEDGDLVFYHAEADSAIFGINTDSRFYVKDAGDNKVELYYDIQLTNKVDLLPGAPVGRFYLERRATAPGFFGNGAPPLIMQGNEAGNSPFEVGFKSVPRNVAITDTDSVADTLTAANHRLVPGDAVLVKGITGVTDSTTYYAVPLNAHTFRIYDTIDDALVDDGATGLVDITNDGESGTVTRLGANAQSLPPCREGTDYKQRIVAVNQEDNLLISDPIDPLHYTPFVASLTAALGTSQRVIGLVPIGPDTLLIYKSGSVVAIENLSGEPDTWRRTEITREYGAETSQAIVQVGRDVWALSRRGVMAISQTDLGAIQGVAVPISRAIQKYIDRIDWTRAFESAAHLWNNRFFLACPITDPEELPDGRLMRTQILTYNFLNEGWEGMWSGARLDVYAFARHTVFGEERLCFVDHECNVLYFNDGFQDGAEQIDDELVTRMFTGPRRPDGTVNTETKLWLKANVNLDHHNASVSAEARAPGHNEVRPLLTKAYDATKYTVAGQPDYDPETATEAQFDQPHRENYALTAGELLVGKVDVHQNITERRRMRVNDWGVQISMKSTRGSCRVRGVAVAAVGTGEQHGRTT